MSRIIDDGEYIYSRKRFIESRIKDLKKLKALYTSYMHDEITLSEEWKGYKKLIEVINQDLKALEMGYKKGGDYASYKN